MRPEFIRDIHRRKAAVNQPVISLEFFPPKTHEGEAILLQKTIPALKALKPDYCSVTYGAGGSTREKTLAIANKIQQEHGLTTMAHLTCINATAGALQAVLAEARAVGIKNILALRGDPPAGVAEFRKIDGGFEFSWQLVRLISDTGGFCIGTAGFPEGHMACQGGREVDWDYLKFKIDCGVDFVLTQLFFNNDDFFRFRDYVEKKGVSIPICPGIIPIMNAPQIKRFTAFCGAKLPATLTASLEKYAQDDIGCTQFGIEYATRQCDELLRQHAAGLHFYTLNKAGSTVQILRNLNLTADANT